MRQPLLIHSLTLIGAHRIPAGKVMDAHKVDDMFMMTNKSACRPYSSSSGIYSIKHNWMNRNAMNLFQPEHRMFTLERIFFHDIALNSVAQLWKPGAASGV